MTQTGAPAQQAPPPQAAERIRRLTIIAQDPELRDEADRILTATVAVPVDRLEPGPRGHRFHVVDYDATTGKLVDPVPDLCDPDVPLDERHWTCRDNFAPIPDEDDVAAYNQTLTSDPRFRAQNVYAIAARTLAAFEFALGRRIDWAFDTHELYIVPRAFTETNAHYSREDRGLFFGYLPGEGGAYETCLSHDIVCHETTHAILDGLRPRFLEPALPDQPAFHEALADVVALFSVFSLDGVVEHALGEADPEGRIPVDRAGREELAKTVLFGVAESLGEAITGVRGSALRRSIGVGSGGGWQDDPGFEEPHRRGEVFVGAVMDAMIGMWMRRLEALTHAGGVNRKRAAEEGATAAAHLLTMVIRSLDYAPAVELGFDDILESIVVADEVIAPEDALHYREELVASFARYGIERPVGRIVDLAKAAVPFRYEYINAASLRWSKQEAYRFIWQNLRALELDSRWHIQVDALKPATRIGPDGLVVQEIVCDYVQVLELTAGQARKMAEEIRAKDPGSENQLTVPDAADLADEVALQLWGGGTLIFDQFGRAKLHQRKALDDWDRQSRRLAYLVRKGLFDSRGRLGFSTGTATGMAFADLHAPDAVAGEAW